MMRSYPGSLPMTARIAEESMIMRRAQLGFGKRAVLLLPLTHRSSSGKKNFNSSEWTVVLRPVTAYVAVAAYARLAPAISRRGPCAGWRLGITPFQPGALISRSLPSRGQYGRSGCVWLYAVIACSGTLPSLASSNPAPSAQLWTLTVQRAHGLGELFQAEDTGRVIEQAYWGTRRHLTTLASRRRSRLGNIHLFLPCPAVGRSYDLVSCPLAG